MNWEIVWSNELKWKTKSAKHLVRKIVSRQEMSLALDAAADAKP